jgi:hypothetical protein
MKPRNVQFLSSTTQLNEMIQSAKKENKKTPRSVNK